MFTNQFLNIAGLIPIFGVISGTMYLVKKNKLHYVHSLPESFMTASCFTYLLVTSIKNGGLNINTEYRILIGVFNSSYCLYLIRIKD